MKVALFGGTGFVGSYLVDELIRQGHKPVLLVQRGSESKVSQANHCSVVKGDIKDHNAIEKTIAGCDAVIYTIGILRQFKSRGITFEELQFQGARRTMDVVIKYGVERFILMSANGVRPNGTEYQQTKYYAEEYLKQTRLKWTIFRPSVIFGDPRGRMEFATQLKTQLIDPLMPAPAFFNGFAFWQADTFMLSPIHIHDVVKVFVQSITNTETIGKIYRLGGPVVLSWKSIIRIISSVSNKNKWIIPVPAWGLKAIATALDRFTWFPITQDQITMLLEGNVCDSSGLFKLFHIKPIPFTEENLVYLKSNSE